MSQKFKIASIEIKEGTNARGDWKSFIITGEDKSKVSTFDSAAGSLKAGDTIEAEIEVKGKFTNLKSFKVIEHGAARPSPKPPSPDREQSIEQSVAVKAVVELVGYKAIPLNHPLFRATLDWLWEKLLPDSVKSPPIEPEKSTGRPVADKSGGNLLPAFKTGAELVNYALKNGWNMADIRIALSINNPTEIKDVEAAAKVLFPE